jgi:hypothetical protein
MVDRLGACICRRLSPSSGSSCKGASRAPPASSSTAFDSETVGGAGFGDGSLAWSLTSPESLDGVAMKARVAGLAMCLIAEVALDRADTIISNKWYRSRGVLVRRLGQVTQLVEDMEELRCWIAARLCQAGHH